MLGELVTSSLVLVLGYAYPAIECFKSVDKNKGDNAELRFWCQYWIIVALVRVLESICDLSMSWMPMYTELKLALFIYLWHPKTKGTTYIYETMLTPLVKKHKVDIDGRFSNLRETAWNLAIYYWHNGTELGQAKMLDFFAPSPSQNNGTQQSPKKDQYNWKSVTSSTGRQSSSSSYGFLKRKSSDKRRSSPLSPFPTYRSVSGPAKSDVVEVQLPVQTQVVFEGKSG
ncbi:hypothetical protein DM860_003393 [Cuscuta australis]|uniref:HVA22-like protein n=1 Tax=Cuscuta australis TaxID=267555 RepID=A0A328DGH0_9ASTE|nr:hypothetical protein DM860_003393 [Cuscuta australis]